MSVEQTDIILHVDIVLQMFAVSVFMNKRKFLMNLMSSPLKG